MYCGQGLRLVKDAINPSAGYEIGVVCGYRFMGQGKCLQLQTSILDNGKYLSVKHMQESEDRRKKEQAGRRKSITFDKEMFLCKTNEIKMMLVQFCQMEYGWGGGTKSPAIHDCKMW